MGRASPKLAPLMTTDAEIRKALAYPLTGANFADYGERYEGKVRDNYSRNGKRTIVISDRISAFDRVLGTLPLKGQILNWIAAWWFEKTRHIADNHVISVPDPSVMVATECKPLPVEMVMRAYLTGSTSTSIWVHYQNGSRKFCGHDLADGMKKHQKLPKPILTPSTKAELGEHDVSASKEEILKLSGMPESEFDIAAKMAQDLFAFGQKVCGERGLILVDTKYEFGKTPDGRIVIIDEIHTPDSSRFWFSNSYQARFDAGQDPESFDKEYVRRYLKGQGFMGDGDIPEIPDDVKVEAVKRYIEAVETITGESFPANLDEPIARLKNNLDLC